MFILWTVFQHNSCYVSQSKQEKGQMEKEDWKIENRLWMGDNPAVGLDMV